MGSPNRAPSKWLQLMYARIDGYRLWWSSKPRILSTSLETVSRKMLSPPLMCDDYRHTYNCRQRSNANAVARTTGLPRTPKARHAVVQEGRQVNTEYQWPPLVVRTRARKYHRYEHNQRQNSAPMYMP